MKIYSYNGKGVLTLREALHLAFLDLSETKKWDIIKMHVSINPDLDLYSWLEKVYGKMFLKAFSGVQVFEVLEC